MSKAPNKPVVISQASQQREVFINRRAIVSLTVSTLALLTLLQPNRELMLDILDNDNDPTIAMAFLNVLRSEDETSAQLDYLSAKQLALLNEFEEAVAMVAPVARFENTPFQAQTFEIYARSLWQIATVRGGAVAEEAAVALSDFLREYLEKFTDDERNQFAQYALQIGVPELAYTLKSSSTTATEQELFMLAQQGGLTEQAYQHAIAIYQTDQSFANLQQVLSLAQQLNQWELGVQLVSGFSDRTCDNTCLQTLIDFLVAADASQLAAGLAYTKAENSTSVQDWLQASQRALAVGELEPATTWLERAVDGSVEVANDNWRQLVDLHLWQQQYTEARDRLLQFVDGDDPADLVRFAINVSYAALDARALEYFLYALTAKGEATLRELREWMIYADRLQGAPYVVARLNDILNNNALEGVLDDDALRLVEVELGRFYNFTGEEENTVALWRRRHDEDSPSQRGQYDYTELSHFIRAFIDTNRPVEALQIAINYLQLNQLESEQLDAMRSLASFVGNQNVLREVQRIYLARQDDSLDPYGVVASHDRTRQSDRDELWQYYDFFMNQEPTASVISEQAMVVLTAILNGAVDAQDVPAIARVKQQLLTHSLNTQQLQELRLQVATFEDDRQTTRELLERLIQTFPQNQRYRVEAMWLSIAEQDLAWLKELYWQVLPEAYVDPELTQLMAYAAQTLGNREHGAYWYARLHQSENVSPADLLSYASFLQDEGREAQAERIRWRVVREMADALQAEPGGQISYRSLLSLFVGEAYAAAQLSAALAENPDVEDISSIMFAQSNNALQRVAYWQAMRMLDSGQFNESVQLALALARDDVATIRYLATQGESLSALERASALAQIENPQLAWQYGETALNSATLMRDRMSLQRFLANEHWHRSHGFRSALGSGAGYDLADSQLEYYRPLPLGQLQVRFASSQADKPLLVEQSYASKQLTLAWQGPRFDYRLGLQHRFGRVHPSIELDQQWQPNPWISHSVSLDWNTPATQSESLVLFGRYSAAQLGTAWQISSRTNLSANVQAQRYQTDFSERLGDGYQLSLRLSETLWRMPNWQAYLQYDLQRNAIKSHNLTRLQRSAHTIQTLTPQAFLADKYRRFAIGQSLIRGTVGRPGPDVKGMRYLVDASLGYNFELAEPDFNINVGLGFRVFGGDELSITGSWQNADLAGNNFTRLNIGYFMDF